MGKFTPSEQQAAYFDWIQNDEGSVIVEAVAGSGKTTTLIHGLDYMEGTIFFGAYNKKIAEEIKERAPKRNGLTISTMHAAGFNIWRRCAPTVKVDSRKCSSIFADILIMEPQYGAFKGSVLDLVSFAKQAAFGALTQLDDQAAWFKLVEHFGVETFDEPNTVVNLAKRVLTKSIAMDTDIIDFDDMILAPLVHHAKMFRYDWVLIDEAQDTNASRRALALAMLRAGGRLVAVGDRHQAIYGFTGADANSLKLITDAVSAKQLPLTVSYRCPKKIIAEAQKYVKHISAHESAPDGEVLSMDYDKMLATIKPGDAVLSRFNAPTITLAYSLIMKGIPARVEGREIGSGLKVLAKRWKPKNFDILLKRLDDYQEREITKYRAAERETQAAAVEDRVTCLKVIIERVMSLKTNKPPVQAVCDEIDRIFGVDDNDRRPMVILSSIHKAKGREFDKVHWLQTGGSKFARKAWEHEAEVNLCYVAVTRAKKTLVLVAMPKKES